MASIIFRIKQGDKTCTGSYSYYDYKDRTAPTRANWLKFGSGKVKEFKSYSAAFRFIQTWMHESQKDVKILEYHEVEAQPVNFEKIEFVRSLVKKYDDGISALLAKLEEKTDGDLYKHILIIPFDTYRENQKKIRGLDVKKTDFIQTSSYKNTYWAFKDEDKLFLVRLAIDSNAAIEKLEH